MSPTQTMEAVYSPLTAFGTMSATRKKPRLAGPAEPARAGETRMGRPRSLPSLVGGRGSREKGYVDRCGDSDQDMSNC